MAPSPWASPGLVPPLSPRLSSTAAAAVAAAQQPAQQRSLPPLPGARPPGGAPRPHSPSVFAAPGQRPASSPPPSPGPGDELQPLPPSPCDAAAGDALPPSPEGAGDTGADADAGAEADADAAAAPAGAAADGAPRSPRAADAAADHPHRDQQRVATPPAAAAAAAAVPQKQPSQPGGGACPTPPSRAPSLSPTSSLHSALSALSSGVAAPHLASSGGGGLHPVHSSGQLAGSASQPQPSPPPAPSPPLHRSASASSLPPAGAAPDAGGDELPPGGGPLLLQVPWLPRLAAVECRRPAPSTVPLATPTSSDYDYWAANRGDGMLFNVGLLADASAPRPVKLAAVDLARNSHWFQALMSNRHELTGTEAGSVLIPLHGIPQPLLERVVGALYASSIELDPHDVEPVYRAADAMQMPALMAACESYLASTCFDDPAADPAWVSAVYDLACDLSRSEFASSISRHFACAAQRDAAGRRAVLSHVLRSPPYGGDGTAQMELLREGHDAAWNGQGPEVLLLHVLIEVADALDPSSLGEMLDKVEWAIMQQEEVAALVDWCLQMPADWPLTPLLKDRALSAVAAQLNGTHQRRYLVWRADVGRLPGAGQRLMSSGALTVATRRLYLCMERAGPAEWGLFLCPPPDVSLYSRVAFHTLFALGPSFERRVATYDVTISKDLRVGAGFGSRTIITEWLGQGRFKQLADGSKWLTVGTIATHHSCVRADP